MLIRRWYYVLPIFLLVFVSACGSGYNNPGTANNGLFGDWNVTMYPSGSQTPAYVFALAMSQEGPSNFTGSSIRYTGSVQAPANMCINANTLSATATVSSGNTFSMTVTDVSSNTAIAVQGTLATGTTDLTGTYSNPPSATCGESRGTMTMSPQ
ncbi:MAG TPA: hypothetical protein VL240_04875 [Candidatus Binatia bacterium]|nr:hypothetical protein [Candidatus Binatia bacterium]